MFSWQIWDTNLTDNSKIGEEFEQNKLSEVCIVNSFFEFIPYLKFASQICHKNIKKLLNGAYLADFGIDIRLRLAILKMK